MVTETQHIALTLALRDILSSSKTAKYNIILLAPTVAKLIK